MRFDARIPAYIAEHLYDEAAKSSRPVREVLADLLVKCVGDDVEGAMD
ncbi:hypothetical protein [Cellulosimicrobium funkei]